MKNCSCVICNEFTTLGKNVSVQSLRIIVNLHYLIGSLIITENVILFLSSVYCLQEPAHNSEFIRNDFVYSH